MKKMIEMEEAREHIQGSPRNRLELLISNTGKTQAEVAAETKVSASVLSRFITGATDHMGDGNIIKLAKYFNVSTDYLLGEVDDPERYNYDLAELGLSLEAAKAMYSGDVDPDTISRLIANKHFQALTGYVAVSRGVFGEDENEMYDEMENFWIDLVDDHVRFHREDHKHAKDAKRAVRAARIEIGNPRMEMLQRLFTDAVNEICEGNSAEVESDYNVKELIDIMKYEVEKRTKPFNLRKTDAEMIVDALTDSCIRMHVPPYLIAVLKDFFEGKRWLMNDAGQTL